VGLLGGYGYQLDMLYYVCAHLEVPWSSLACQYKKLVSFLRSDLLDRCCATVPTMLTFGPFSVACQNVLSGSAASFCPDPFGIKFLSYTALVRVVYISSRIFCIVSSCDDYGCHSLLRSMAFVRRVQPSFVLFISLSLNTLRREYNIFLD
jgi:hypothetical protein